MGKFKQGAQAVGSFVKKNPVVPISATTLAVSSAGYAANRKESKERKESSAAQLEALSRLTSTLDKVDGTIKKSESKPKVIERRVIIKEVSAPKKKSRFFSKSFKQKDFGSTTSKIITGAGAGMTIGATLSQLAPQGLKTTDSTSPKSFRHKYNSSPTVVQRLAITGAGMLIGAALGGLYGILEKGADIISRGSADNRLMKKVVEGLKKSNFKEGYDFTLDPKQATNLKTRVCIITTRISGELRVLINTQADIKLKELTENITSNIKNSNVSKAQGSNRFNEITVSTISDGSADASLIVSMCEQFIRNGYPVYLVEVGN